MGARATFFNCMMLLALLAAPATAVAQGNGKAINIVVLGDSLTAGFGLKPSQAFPVRLEAALRERGANVHIINAGVSGDTTAAGLLRLDWAVSRKTDGVIVELGANDALRGLSPKKARANLDQILKRLKSRGVAIMLAGMLAPPSMGSRYTKAFNGIFPSLAKKHDVVFYPFFLKDVAVVPELNQMDGMHPNPKGVAIIVKNITPRVEALIERIKQRRLARSGGLKGARSGG